LPAGFSNQIPNGFISGTPTAVGTSTFTVKVTSGTLTASKTFNLTITGGTSSPDFSINFSPVSQSVNQGTTANYYFSVVGSNGFNGPINLSIPGGTLGGAISVPSTVYSGGTGQVSVNTTSLSPSTSSVIISAVSGAITKSYYLTLTIQGSSSTTGSYTLFITPGSTIMEPRRTEESTRMGIAIVPEQERLMQLLRGQVPGATVVGASYSPGTPVSSTPRQGLIPGDVRYDIALGVPSLNLIIVGSNHTGEQRYYLGVQIGPRPNGTHTERTEWARTESLQLRETIRMVEITNEMRATGYTPGTELRFTGDGLVIYAADAQGRIARAVHDSNNAYGIGISISYGRNYSDDVLVGGRLVVTYGPWTASTNRQ
jgi:hypothetical protein